MVEKQAMKEYIFGYGSLIEKESRLRTTPNAATVYPLRVHGFKRGWFGRTGVPGLSTTFLGCVKDENHDTTVNGVIYEVSPEELKETDEREQGYERVKIKWEDITDYSGTIDQQSNIWIYMDRFSNRAALEESFPSADFPIVQSYVDICINGCLEIESLFPGAREEHFAKEFIRTTHYWSAFWVNDRIYPRRPFIYRPNAYTIDQLLKENLPNRSLFDKIYLEG